MDRRRFLATTGAGLTLTSTSGCLGLAGGSSPFQPVDCSPFDESQPSSGWLDGGSESSSLNSISGSWPSPHHDNQNTGYNPDAEGPRECPSRRWNFRVKITDEHQRGPAPGRYYLIPVSPAFHDETLYFCDSEDELYALDMRTGTVQWTKSVVAAFISGPTYHDGVLYLSTDGYLQALDVASRETLWRVREPISKQDLEGGPRYWMRTAPTVTDEYVFAGTGHGEFCAIDIDSQEIAWTDTIEVGLPGASEGGHAEDNQEFRGPPVIEGDTVCIPSNNGRLYAYEIQSGERKWVFQPGGRFQAAATIWNGSVFSTNTSGIYSISLADGSVNWKYQADVHYMSPAIDGETLIASAGPDKPNRAVVALDVQTGDEKWRVTAATGSDAAPAIANGTTVIGVSDGLLAIDIASGSPQWFAPGAANIRNAPLLVGDAVIAADLDGYVYAIQ